VTSSEIASTLIHGGKIVHSMFKLPIDLNIKKNLVCYVKKFTRYRIQYEPMVKEAFESLFNVKVLPAGLFVDEQYNFLAGSPDGLMGEN
jgi:hypothetical protein